MTSVPTVDTEQFDFASDGKMRKRLREVLLKYFPDAAEMRFIVDECFGKELSHIALGSNYEETLYQLIRWLWGDPNGRLRPFLDAAKKTRPNAAGELDAVAGSLVQSLSAPATDNLQDTIQQLLDGLAARKDLFRYLNAYKELHEVIHDLHRNQPRISAVVSSRSIDPSQPLPDDVASSFNDWIARATQCAGETEFPDEPPAWIQSMVGAAAILTGPDASRWPWAMERLQVIPPREMGRLNDKLIDNARRLRCEQLTEHLDAILAAIAAIPKSAKVKDVEGRLTRFRSLCAQLVQWVRMHDLCQRIDDLLREAAGLALVSPRTLTGWHEASQLFDELVEVCPEDFRAVRTQKAATSFGSAQDDVTAAAGFAVLTEQFADLFHETDKCLLKVSNRIGNEVFSLDKELRKFS